ncbi:ABC transporter ATP-binding protein [Sphaerisporangium flaviroseum]|uniref:ABC transporter ATP-binding protein n=1 Tax=Sphaerisporangium flaviroseum TaxID=509199 RepID=A0ABP7HE33_9ACTN
MTIAPGQTVTRTKIGIRGVSKVFQVRGADQPFTALDRIHLDIRGGEFLTLVGPSGCGKSTLLDMIAGLSVPSSGEIVIDGTPVTGPGLDRGIVFQQYALFPWRTAAGNVEFGLEALGTRRSGKRGAVPKKERAEVARHYLDLVGLSGFEDRYPHELSGGMRQRVAIARSLAFDPDVLLMDEPFAALDAQTRESLQEQLLHIWEKTGKTVVFITHGIDEAVYLGQRVAVMTSKPGRIKEIISVEFDSREGDLRADARFGEYRHHIWTLLRDEVAAAQREEANSVG